MREERRTNIWKHQRRQSKLLSNIHSYSYTESDERGKKETDLKGGFAVRALEAHYTPKQNPVHISKQLFSMQLK